MATDWKPNIFDYTEYRKYLKAYYAAAKQHSRGFSYRAFSKRGGFTSPNFLKLVIDGTRNIGPKSVGRFAKALAMDPAETRFFRNLVAFNQAKTPDAKNQAFARVAATRRFRAAREIDADLFAYLSKWYYPAIRELIASQDFREDSAWIAAQLVPNVKPSEAERALDTVVRLGLAVRRQDGHLERGDPTLSAGPEVHSLAVRNYHAQMLDRAKDSIGNFPSSQRALSATTVCIRADSIDDLKRRVHDFREAFLDYCDRQSDGDVVYQLNFQLFPLTKPPESSE